MILVFKYCANIRKKEGEKPAGPEVLVLCKWPVLLFVAPLLACPTSNQFSGITSPEQVARLFNSLSGASSAPRVFCKYLSLHLWVTLQLHTQGVGLQVGKRCLRREKVENAPWGNLLHHPITEHPLDTHGLPPVGTEGSSSQTAQVLITFHGTLSLS